MLGINMDFLPGRVVFGAGEIEKIGVYASQFGKHVFFVLDPFYLGSEMAARIEASLAAEGISCTVFSEVAPNPTASAVDKAGDQCRQAGCDLVLVLGGGSSIDTAKMVAVIAKNGGHAWGFVDGSCKNEYGALPIIAVPTTAGTGSEATHIAVVTNEELHFKGGYAGKDILPAIALIDPVIMSSMPPRLTAYTAIDAFAHCFESLLVPTANAFSNAVAYEGIRLFSDHIRTCVKNGADIEARGALALASTFGGMAITSGGTTWPHGLGQTLGAMFNASHGASIASCLSNVVRYRTDAAVPTFARVACILKPELAVLPQTEQAAALPDVLDALFAEILPQKVRMRDFGLTEDRLEEYLDILYASGNCYGQDNYPVRLEREDIRTIVKQCL